MKVFPIKVITFVVPLEPPSFQDRWNGTRLYFFQLQSFHVCGNGWNGLF
jgi:hypothetical protein